MVITEGMADGAVGKYVKAELYDRTYRDYPVVDFVEDVWGYKPQDLPRRRTYTLPFAAVNGYAASTEETAYVHLVDIMASLVAQVYPESSTDDSATTDPSSAASSLYSDILSRARVPTNSSSSYLVNMRDAAVDRSRANNPGAGCKAPRGNWEWFPAYGEVKKTCTRKTAYEADMPIDITRLRKVSRRS